MWLAERIKASAFIFISFDGNSHASIQIRYRPSLLMTQNPDTTPAPLSACHQKPARRIWNKTVLLLGFKYFCTACGEPCDLAPTGGPVESLMGGSTKLQVSGRTTSAGMESSSAHQSPAPLSGEGMAKLLLEFGSDNRFVDFREDDGSVLLVRTPNFDVEYYGQNGAGKDHVAARAFLDLKWAELATLLSYIKSLQTSNREMREALEKISCKGQLDTPGSLDEPWSARVARGALERIRSTLS